MPIPLIIPIVATGLQVVGNVSKFQAQRQQERKSLIEANLIAQQADYFKDGQELETYAAQLRLKQTEDEIAARNADIQSQALPILFAIVVFFLGFIILNGTSSSSK